MRFVFKNRDSAIIFVRISGFGDLDVLGPARVDLWLQALRGSNNRSRSRRRQWRI